MKLILLGAPGSGKGTVSECLVKEFDLKHVSPGVILREEIKKETTLGKDIKAFVERGDLVPDQFVVEVVKLDINGKDNYVLDGFPRTIVQAESIEEIGVDHVIELEVSEDIVIERFSGRRVCPKCNAGYHIKFLKPEVEGVCNKCQTELIQRKDDNPEIIKERFRVYHEKTQPLIDYYKNKGILVSVDASPVPKEMCDNVIRVVKEWI
ncbi:nucleoside monophosphate kinase [archaeon]|jgi:adenylate kinase|nr:nucleoside monophosphate kinase [archaeon]MBT3450614.1 nucleoside monophosphate kinase [archaeon]MBT6868700.1 nucleoside monophosphate kinase [archaeon]MBT7193488.1 nucleoside monophosphate kinase [archaeon]MBT7381079.1 nucleoside monophosphate kinase [archaeon]